MTFEFPIVATIHSGYEPGYRVGRCDLDPSAYPNGQAVRLALVTAERELAEVPSRGTVVGTLTTTRDGELIDVEIHA